MGVGSVDGLAARLWFRDRAVPRFNRNEEGYLASLDHWDPKPGFEEEVERLTFDAARRRRRAGSGS
jgi:hypothetical protein